jgi:hypothetical protein
MMPYKYPTYWSCNCQNKNVKDVIIIKRKTKNTTLTVTIPISTRKNCFRYLKLMSPLNAAICTTIGYTLWVEWYYIKNNYLTLRLKVKVPRRSLRYATHRLMVLHMRTIFQWTVLLDLFELYDLEVKGQGPTKVITVCDTLPYGHAPTYQLSLTYLERPKCYGPDKKILFKK